jgi:hypothetical protein
MESAFFCHTHPPAPPNRPTAKGETPGGTRAHYDNNAGYVTGAWEPTCDRADAPHQDTCNLYERTLDDIERSTCNLNNVPNTPAAATHSRNPRECYESCAADGSLRSYCAAEGRLRALSRVMLPDRAAEQAVIAFVSRRHHGAATPRAWRRSTPMNMAQYGHYDQ